jgi:peptidoglycan/xylan/chitin deacetylase (PgdA/CDA1 family)
MAVLVFHKVDRKFEIGFTNVKPRRFFQQISGLLYHGIEIVDSPEEAMHNNRKVFLTFDDGYDCFYKNVVPFLNTIGKKAAVFIVSSYVGRTNGWDVRLSYAPFVHMDERQLREVSDMGFEIGSHTSSHKDLSRLDYSAAWSELDTSKKKIEDITGKEVRSVAFPFGRYNANVVKWAREAGYQLMFGLGSGTREGVIARIPVYKIDTPASVRRKVSKNKIELLKCDLIHSFANISALISTRRSSVSE